MCPTGMWGVGRKQKKKKDLGDFLEQILQVDWLKKQWINQTNQTSGLLSELFVSEANRPEQYKR